MVLDNISQHKHQKLINLIVVIFLMTILGCGGWSYISKAKTETVNNQYSFMLPKGWMQLKNGSTISFTRDSVSLQKIKIEHYSKKQGFEKIKKKFSEKALPFETAELYLAEIKAVNEGLKLEVIENSPVSIAGNDGFKLHIKTRTNSGVNYQILVTGFADETGFYALSYEAPSLRYFDLDKHNYDTLVKSFMKK